MPWNHRDNMMICIRHTYLETTCIPKIGMAAWVFHMNLYHFIGARPSIMRVGNDNQSCSQRIRYISKCITADLRWSLNSHDARVHRHVYLVRASDWNFAVLHEEYIGVYLGWIWITIMHVIRGLIDSHEQKKSQQNASNAVYVYRKIIHSLQWRFCHTKYCAYNVRQITTVSFICIHSA